MRSALTALELADESPQRRAVEFLADDLDDLVAGHDWRSLGRTKTSRACSRKREAAFAVWRRKRIP